MKTFYITITLFLAAIVKQAGANDATNTTVSATTNSVLLTPDYLSQLADELRTNNPALRAAYQRTNAAFANLGAVRTWEDPVAKVGGLDARESMRSDEGDIIYGVEQKLPLFGKPKLARRVAEAELATESANVEFQFQQLRVDLARAAFRLAPANEIVAIGEQDLAWLDLIGQTLESRYGAGQATLIEVLQLQNERSNQATALETDRKRLSNEQVTLNRLLNRDLLTPWPRLELPPLAGPVLFNQRLVNFALRYEPKAQLMRQQIKQAKAAVDMTRRQRMPDVSVGLEARNYSGDGSFRQGMLVLSMNLPWANSGKYGNDIKREESKLKASEFDLNDYQAGLRQEVYLLTVTIDAARREALLYRDEILPRNESALESIRAGWESNRSPVRDLLDARRMLLDARLRYARAVAEQYEAMSDLVLCCGIGDLSALQMIGAEPETVVPAK